jgi:hypothetical protein
MCLNPDSGLSVDDQFEVCFPSLSKSDTSLVAVMTDDSAIGFRGIEGRLFRTFLHGSWTVDRLNKDRAPQ